MVRVLRGVLSICAVWVVMVGEAAATSGTLSNIPVSVHVRETPQGEPATLQGVVSVLGFAENSSGNGIVVTAVVTAKASDDSTTPVVNQVISAPTMITAEGSGRKGCCDIPLDIGPDILANDRTIDVQPFSPNFTTVKASKPVTKALCSLVRATEQQQQKLLEQPQPRKVLIGLLLPAIQKLNRYIESDFLYKIQVNGQLTTNGGPLPLNGSLTINSVTDGISNTLMIEGVLNGTVSGNQQPMVLVNSPVTASIIVNAGSGDDTLTYRLENVFISSFSASLDPISLTLPERPGRKQIIAILIALSKDDGSRPLRSTAAKIRKLNTLLQRV